MVTLESNRSPSKKKTKRRVNSIEAGEWVYHTPFLFERPDHPSRWVCRRRNTRTKKVETIFLDASGAREALKARAEHAATAAGPGVSERVLKDAFRDWLATLDVRPVTLKEYKSNTKLYARLLGGDRTVDSITFSDISALFANEWKERAGRTKLGHRALLTRFFAWAIKARLTRENPAKEIDIPKAWTRATRKAARETGQALTLEEARKLLVACKKKVTHRIKDRRRKRGKQSWPAPAHLELFVFISLRTGLRVGNIVGTEFKPPLRWSMVDLDAGVFSFPGEWMKNDMDFVVPIHAELIERLRALLVSLGRVPAPEEPILPGVGVNLRKSFNSALKRAGLGGRGFRIHDLKHTFVSWLGESCVHAVMQKLAGHAPSNITDRYGQHQEVETLREGINSLPRLLGAASAVTGTAS